ncbi:hypothetical protein C8256_01895 [Kluyvera genomosp. 2]|uniref:Uncharacterized protein n=1 Tax=Kluyvera genomosp. 2 TaxID=2774054 RepID=A0A2T2Y8B5_9ENTR|nr:hypothetical protein C8256_01895 [Kluyvera genomosp. 2]
MFCWQYIQKICLDASTRQNRRGERGLALSQKNINGIIPPMGKFNIVRNVYKQAVIVQLFTKH